MQPQDHIQVWVSKEIFDHERKTITYDVNAMILCSQDGWEMKRVFQEDAERLLDKLGYRYSEILTDALNDYNQSAKKVNLRFQEATEFNKGGRIYGDTKSGSYKLGDCCQEDCIYKDMDPDQPCWGQVDVVAEDDVTGIMIHSCKGHELFHVGSDYVAEDQ